jgi:arabinan endo-1,5-alpha-L-arabinosidase
MNRKKIAILIVVLAISFLTATLYVTLNQPFTQPNENSEEKDSSGGKGDYSGGNSMAEPIKQGEPPVFKNVSVHDPSIIKDGDTFYVFGSHIDAAKSIDLIQWETFSNGYTTPGNVIYGDLSQNLAESFAWAGENDADSKGGYAVWAPDVFWNEHYVNEDGTKGAFMTYYSASSTYIRSAIGYAVSKNIQGPYKYIDTVIYSGMTEEEDYDSDSKVNKKWTNTNIPDLIDKGVLSGPNPNWFNHNGSYNNQMYPNAIDANLFYGKDEKLWMTYGSWSGGIFILELDKETGEAFYPGKDGKTEDGRLIDQYFGTKIAGGYGKSGEGPYVVYDKVTNYYYLYVTYGWLGADGGYNMRQFRSENPIGPYLDVKGQDAVLPINRENILYGNKLMGNFLFERKPGEPGMGTGIGYVSPGHNSVYLDPESNQQFLFFHSRFPQTGEMHQLRVHQMFMNKDNWPVVAPYRYAGETLEEVKEAQIIGNYKFINHGIDNSDHIKKSVLIRINEDHTISGAVEGRWEKTGDYYAEITIKGLTYNGVFVRQWDPILDQYVLAFTALSSEGVSIWGSKETERTDEEVVRSVLKSLDLGDTKKIISDLTLPTEGAQQTKITWETSDANVVSREGKVRRPGSGSNQVTATLTATVTKGEITETKTFTITVLPHKDAALVAHYTFEDNTKDETGNFSTAKITGDRIDNTGGTISYVSGKKGQAAMFDGESGIRLPNGLIAAKAYSVSLWLKPEELTAFTTAFFGAKDSNNWVSVVPSGPVEGNTMIWSGSSKWYDAPTGLTINTGEWTHVAFSVDGGTIVVYVNGKKTFTGTDFPHNFTSSNAQFSLGVNWWDPPYKGLMDEVFVYEGTLTPEQVSNLAKE